jgi:hypothetical protein
MLRMTQRFVATGAVLFRPRTVLTGSDFPPRVNCVHGREL